jgi:hypothetical protein
MDNAEVLMPVAVLGGLAVFWYVVIKYITDYLLKKKMIDKGYVNEEGKALFKTEESNGNKYAALKWGLIAFFGGLSLVLIEFIPFGPESPLPYGLVILFVAGGFLVYYNIVKKEQEKNQ